MVGKLASQIAGYKLSLILCVLLLPFLLVCYLTTSSLRDDIEETSRSADALALHRQMMPLLFAVQAGTAGQQGVLAALDKIAASVSNDGIRQQLQELHALAHREGVTSDQFSESLAKVTSDVSIKSGLTGVVGPQSVFLSSVAVQQVPEVLQAMSAFRQAVAKALAKPVLDSGDERAIREALSTWRSAVTVMQRQLQVARLGSRNSGSYQNIMVAVHQLDAPLYAINRALDSSSAEGLPAVLGKLSVMGSGRRDRVKRVELTWTNTVNALGQLLAERNDTLIWRLKLVLAGALAVSLTGILTAFYLFRPSFKRLDELEVARVQAEGAQRQSEEMNRRLTQINNEIVHLNQELADKMRRLKEAQDELLKRGRLEQLGQLTATVAHELRNPLGAVRTSAFLLERKVKDKGLGVETQLQRINNGISRCDSIITQLLDFSRTKQISAQPADLDEWLTSSIEEEARRLPAVVEIECTLGLANAEVPFDSARLQRAIINLVSNASEAMVGTGEDPSKFTVKVPRLQISTRRDGDMAVISVSDNGPGISPDVLGKIREPLFTTKSFGTGLGIPAVEQIANQHGGRLEIHSEEGKGATFSIYLPLAQQTPAVA